MAERQLSPFTRLLLNISQQLTQEDLSNIKLILVLEGPINRAKLDSLHIVADLFRVLFSHKLIQENDLTLLVEILTHIHRRDCVKLIEEYISSRQTSLGAHGDRTPSECGPKGPEVDLECDSDKTKSEVTNCDDLYCILHACNKSDEEKMNPGESFA